MKIKNYEEFVNEEINLKKALVGGAIIASMANPSCKKAEITKLVDKPKADTTVNVKLRPTSDTTTTAKKDTTVTKVVDDKSAKNTVAVADSTTNAIDSLKTTHIIKAGDTKKKEPKTKKRRGFMRKLKSKF